MITLRAVVIAGCCLILMQTLAAARCPPGFRPGSVDKYTHTATCAKSNTVDCGGGRSCPLGSTCTANGGCSGIRGTGPLCGSEGRRCQAGYLCNHAADACYDPRTQYACGAATCGFNVHYLAGNVCAPCQGRHHARRRS